MNTETFKLIFIIIIIPYNKNCHFFTNFKKPHSTPHIAKNPSRTNPRRSDQNMVAESSSDLACFLSVPNCNPVNMLSLSTGNH